MARISPSGLLLPRRANLPIAVPQNPRSLFELHFNYVFYVQSFQDVSNFDTLAKHKIVFQGDDILFDDEIDDEELPVPTFGKLLPTALSYVNV